MARLDTPTRRTYVTGDSLPSVTTNAQPFDLAPNDQDSEYGAVRAFTVNIRNRDSTSSVYVREGSDGDEIEIAPHEHYPIYEPNGTRQVTLRGENGGETVEFRVLLGHNDFSLQDKIDGFLRSLSSYVGTATRDTRITGQDVKLDVGTIDDLSAISDTITVDDITATSATFDGDITGQTSFDLRTFDRVGYIEKRNLNEQGASLSESGLNNPIWQIHTWNLETNAAEAGQLLGFTYTIYDPNADAEGEIHYYGPRVQVDRGSTGSWENVSPQYAGTPQNAVETQMENAGYNVGLFEPDFRCDLSYFPSDPPRFEAGDSIRLRFNADAPSSPSSTNYSADIQVEALISYKPKA